MGAKWWSSRLFKRINVPSSILEKFVERLSVRSMNPIWWEKRTIIELIQNETEQEKRILTEVEVNPHEHAPRKRTQNDNQTTHSSQCSKNAKAGATTDAPAIWERNKRWLTTKSNLLIPRKWITKNRFDLKDFRKLNEWLARRRYENPRSPAQRYDRMGKTFFSRHSTHFDTHQNPETSRCLRLSHGSFGKA